MHGSGAREVYLCRSDGRTWGRSTNPTTSGYLLTGLLACKHGGGSLHVSRQSGRRRGPLVLLRLRTAAHPRRSLPGRLRVNMRRLDDAVLDVVTERVLQPAHVVATVRAAASRLAAHPSSRRERTRLTRELREVEQELRRYAEAIATAGPLPSLLEALQIRERRRAALSGELGQLDALKRTTTALDDVALTAELGALCDDWRTLLIEDVAGAQPILRKLLPERLMVERAPTGFRLTGMAAFGPLMAGIVMRAMMVPPG